MPCGAQTYAGGLVSDAAPDFIPKIVLFLPGPCGDPMLIFQGCLVSEQGTVLGVMMPGLGCWDAVPRIIAHFRALKSAR